MLHVLDLMEPEETIGNLWHDMASRWGQPGGDGTRAARLDGMQRSVAALFRALGGAPGVEIAAAPLVTSQHRPDRIRRIGTPRERGHLADFDGDRLRLPPVIDVFPAHDLNRACYLWLAALAARVELPAPDADPLAADRAEIAALAAATRAALAACPGLREAHAALCRHTVAHRRRGGLPGCEAAIERLVLDHLGGHPSVSEPLAARAPRGYLGYAPVPFWLRLRTASGGGRAAADPAEAPAPAMAVASRKDARREERDQANRNDSFIIHRFETIMSWAESLNLNRMVDDDDQDNAAKAAEDQDHLTLSQTVRRAATRLRLSLDLSPQEAEQERLAGRFTYPPHRILPARPYPRSGNPRGGPRRI